MSFIGSSECWGDQATARLCQLIMLENNGKEQQIVENRTDLLDLMSLEELQKPDDLGLSLQFLAIVHDQPDALKYLHKRGIDLGVPCDPMNYGTPYFYAVSLGKARILETLNSLLYSYQLPCETAFQCTPRYHILRKDDSCLLETLDRMETTERNAFQFFRKNFLRSKSRNAYLRKYACICKIQRAIRGFFGRKFVKLVKAGLADLKRRPIGFESIAEGSESLPAEDSMTHVSAGGSQSAADEDESESAISGVEDP